MDYAKLIRSREFWRACISKRCDNTHYLYRVSPSTTRSKSTARHERGSSLGRATTSYFPHSLTSPTIHRFPIPSVTIRSFCASPPPQSLRNFARKQRLRLSDHCECTTTTHTQRNFNGVKLTPTVPRKLKQNNFFHTRGRTNSGGWGGGAER